MEARSRKDEVMLGCLGSAIVTDGKSRLSSGIERVRPERQVRQSLGLSDKKTPQE